MANDIEAAARAVLAQCSYSVHPDGTELVTPFHIGEFNRAMLELRAALAAPATVDAKPVAWGVLGGRLRHGGGGKWIDICETQEEAESSANPLLRDEATPLYALPLSAPPAPGAVEEARKAFYEACRAAADSHVRNNASMSGTRLVLQGRDINRTFDALLAAEAADRGGKGA